VADLEEIGTGDQVRGDARVRALTAVVVALVASNMGTEVVEWATNLWNTIVVWIQGWIE
jgi:uncharacterized membrane-anchored protein